MALTVGVNPAWLLAKYLMNYWNNKKQSLINVYLLKSTQFKTAA